ncbi:MAG: hypothetical protein JO072_01105 [Parafilimonas sp.]|nr:hypothetical protein [Parafilimonas sp.]
MKPLTEFLLVCVLIFAAGCSAIAGIFKAGLWSGIIVAVSIVAVIAMLTHGTKSKQ